MDDTVVVMPITPGEVTELTPCLRLVPKSPFGLETKLQQARRVIDLDGGPRHGTLIWQDVPVVMDPKSEDRA